MRIIRLGSFLGAALIFVALFSFFRTPLRNGVLSARGFFTEILESDDYKLAERLKTENALLRSELGELYSRNIRFNDSKYNYLEAQVYSYFPLNNQGVVVINKGSVDGVKVGMPVLTPEKAIFGKIKSVKRTQSEVLTISDSSWRSSVFLGDAKRKAIVVGGVSPFIDLISREDGDIFGKTVFSSSEDLPYGFLIGLADEPKSSSDAALLRANLKFSYKFEDLNSVFVITDFP